MKLRFLLIMTLATITEKSAAQNMIANNGFEAYSALPTGPGEWWKVSGWNNVNNQAVFAWPYASPDYLSTGGTGQAHLPNSIYGNVNPYSGNAIMGFVTYYNQGAADFREYISRPLNTPMVFGQQYTFSFMMTNGMSGQYCGSGSNHIGVCFSVSPLAQSQHEPINVTPQWEISSVWWNTSWQLITFNYTATAAYRYFTIGNFYNDASTAHTVFNASSPSSFGAYYFIDEMIVQPTTPLPVLLLDFSGENNNNINHLSWTTATEIDNDHFNVERSSDGIVFEMIGTVAGNGNSTQALSYNYDDNVPLDGIGYYRLKQVDYNGAINYSQTIAIRNNKNNLHCFVYRGEESGKYILKCSLADSGNAAIINTDGKILRAMKISESSEMKIYLIDQSPGIYILRITDSTHEKNFKLIND